MNFLVSLSEALEQESYITILNQMGVGVELQSYDTHCIVSRAGWEGQLLKHKKIRPFISNSLTMHGPLMGMNYHHVDHILKTAVQKRMDLTYEIACELKPNKLVFHAGYQDWFTCFKLKESWLKAVASYWCDEIKRYAALNVTIVLENVAETDPAPLIDLVDRVGHEHFGLCLDVGHANIFSKIKLSSWVEQMGNRLKHLHLHDNHGQEDEHLPIGLGTIDYEDLFSGLYRTVTDLTVALEVEAPPNVVLSNLQEVLRCYSHPC